MQPSSAEKETEAEWVAETEARDSCNTTAEETPHDLAPRRLHLPPSGEEVSFQLREKGAQQIQTHVPS